MAKRRRSVGRTLTVLLGAASMVVAGGISSARAAPSDSPAGHQLSPTDHFAQRVPDAAGTDQVAQLRAQGKTTQADQMAAMLATPQAVWFIGDTPDKVHQQVAAVTADAAQQQTVPVLVMYNVPGRDCSQYSAGGAATDAAYRAWVDGFVAGLGSAHAVVLVEPDGLANLPSDCPSAYPGQDINTLTSSRIANISYAAHKAESSDPNSLVYLDGGNSGWHSVGDMAKRLYDAGVGDVQGLFLNVSNFHYAVNSDYYGTWISDCLAYATPLNSAHKAISAGNYGNCGDQFYNGGPANNWNGGAMSPYGKWSPTSSNSALNTSGVDSRYAQELGSARATAHVVVDTSRAGAGVQNMAGYAKAPYNQPANVITGLNSGNWCNPPGAKVGPLPTAHPDASTFPLLDAHVWVKTVGESDGQCNIAGGARAWDYSVYNPWNWDTTTQKQKDPLWGRADPAAGVWFTNQALRLAQSMPQ